MNSESGNEVDFKSSQNREDFMNDLKEVEDFRKNIEANLQTIQAKEEGMKSIDEVIRSKFRKPKKD